MKIASAVLLSCALVAAVNAGNPGVGTSTDIGGAVAGDFEYLGSLCFPAGTTSTITIDVTSFGNMSTAVGLKVLFYDDQAGSFTSLNKKGQSCSERQDLSKQLCVGKSCVSGYSVGVDANPLTINVQESIARQWFFVASDCTLGAPAIQLKYKVSSKGAVDCSQMDLSRGGNFSGLVVFIVFLVLIGAVLAATTFIFYKRSQVPGMSAMPDTYEQL